MGSRGATVRLRRRRLSLPTASVAAVAGALAAYAGLVLLPWTAAVAGVAALALGGVLVVLLCACSLLRRPDGRVPWLLVAAGMLLALVLRGLAAYLVGETGPVLPSSAYAEEPWALVAVVAGHALVLAGLVALVRSTTGGVPRGLVVDALLVGAVVSAALAVLLGPWLHAAGIGTVGALALVARTGLSVALVLTAGAAVTLRGRRRDARLDVAAAALACFAAGEVLGLVCVVVPAAASGPAGVAVGALRLVATGLFVVAATRPASARADVAPPRRTLRAVSAAVLSVACVLLAADHAPLMALPHAAWGLVVVVLFVGGVRMTLVSGEVARLLEDRRLNTTDDLTGLHSRRGLREALDHHTGESVLLLLDLDGFKEVNDRCGLAVGDEVLRVVAERLRRATSGPRVLARLGADEFAVLLLGGDAARATEVAGRVLAATTPPITVGDRQLRLTASAGLAVREPGHSAEEVLRRADVAMQQGRRSSAGPQLFDEAVDAGARHRERLLDDLRGLLDAPEGRSRAGRVVAHYQPQLDADGAVSGVEALVRWEHPELGLLQPVAFIDLAEEHGLLPELTERVLRQAVAETARWRAQGHDLRVAVNLSASCLDWPRLLDVVDEVLHSRLVPASALVLEVTETGLVSDAARGLEVAAQLVERGIELSIDDYGTGYSSLAHLNHLPARELKLDRAFTRRLLEDGRTATIVRATIDLAHDLGMRLVAEGVEDEATLRAITAIGCDVTQGYWHSRPLPASELTGWLAQRARTAPRPAPSAR